MEFAVSLQGWDGGSGRHGERSHLELHEALPSAGCSDVPALHQVAGTFLA